MIAHKKAAKIHFTVFFVSIGILLSVLFLARYGRVPAYGGKKALTKSYRSALSRTHRWLDDLKVDPLQLEQKGVNGKKKLAEILDAYYTIYAYTADEILHRRIISRVRGLVQITYQDKYHDQSRLLIRQKRGTPSYLRICYLMDKFGLPVDDYKKNIFAAQSDIDEYVKKIGVADAMCIGLYYDYFGLPRSPVPPGKQILKGNIALRRRPPEYTWLNKYELTHEVFAAFEYGSRRYSDIFNEGDREYLEQVVPVLLEGALKDKDVDLAGELVSCMNYLDMQDLPIYLRSLKYLLASQNKNGTWGDYRAQRRLLGDIIDQRNYLHTTTVVMRSLIEAFNGSWESTGR